MASPDDFRTVAELVEAGKIAQVTTVNADGQLVSRPLALLDRPFDGELYFFTPDPSPKTEQVAANDQVNVALQAKNGYLSIAGRGSVSRDQTMIDGLWNAEAEAWFDGGRQDPSVALLKVRAESAEYWTLDSPKPVTLVKYAAAVLKGGRPDVGDNKTVELP